MAWRKVDAARADGPVARVFRAGQGGDGLRLAAPRQGQPVDDRMSSSWRDRDLCVKIAAFGQGNGCEALPVERNVRRARAAVDFQVQYAARFGDGEQQFGYGARGIADAEIAGVERGPAGCQVQLAFRGCGVELPLIFPDSRCAIFAYPVEADVGRTLTGCALGCALPFVYQRDRQRLLDEAQ